MFCFCLLPRLFTFTVNKSKMQPNLKGCNILELDSNHETLWAWSFPTVTDAQKHFVLRKYADLTQNQPTAYCKFQDNWCYIYVAQVFETDTLPRVKQCALVLWSSECHPEKYLTFSRILCKRYCKTGDPCIVLQLYLSVMTTGVCVTEENGTFLADGFENGSEKNNNAKLIEIINMFGLETILIYTALLLNKRLLVYDHNLSNLVQIVETLPSFMTHRDLRKGVYPWVHLVSDEINDLKKRNGYIAGSTDSTVASKTDLFDILVNVAAREVAVAPHARDAFLMTKTHKDIALFLVQLAENKDPNISFEVGKKTQELLSQLRSLAVTETPEGHKMISIEVLRDRHFPQALENFLFNLAITENLMLL